MADIYLIRHGQASFGQANYDALSSLGIKQAGMIGDGFNKRGVGFDRVIKGSMQRHAQTAEHCLSRMDYSGEVEVDARFNEYDHEEVLVRLKPEFADKADMASYLAASPNPRKAFQLALQEAIQRWMSGQHDHDYTESWLEFKNRCHSALFDIVKNAGNAKHIAVFTSGGPVSLAVQAALHLPDETAIQLSWSTVNGSVTRFQHNRERVSLSFFNDYSHFESVDSSTVTQR